MLLLLFQAGNQTFGLDARQIIEVAPYPLCAPLPHAPAYVGGLAAWRGYTIPVIDLIAMITGVPAQPLLSTRLIVVEYPMSDGRSHPLGLVAEKAVETIVVEQNCHEPQKVKIPDAPYLNGTIVSNGKLVQPLALEELLPAAVRALLFPDSEAS